MTSRPLQDDVYLHAYVDGELSDAEVREVEARLLTDAKARVLVASLAAQRNALLAKFELPTNCDVTKQMAARVLDTGAPAKRRSARVRAAVFALTLAAAAAAGYFVRDATEPAAVFADPQFVSAAVGAHAVYAPELRHAVEVGAADERHLVYWLSKRIESPVRIAKAAGWSLVGGRLLADANLPAAQMMYEDANGRRVTIFQRAKTGHPDQSLRFVAGESVRAFYWVEGGAAFVVAGSLEKFELKALAQAFNTSLSAAAAAPPATNP